MFLLPNNYWYVTKTVHKGHGVFAKKEIKAGTVIGDYLGKVVSIAECNFDNARDEIYLMYFNDESVLQPDLSKIGIHLLNNSCTPNCWMYMHHGHTLFFAIKDIVPDEELTISYLLSPLDDSCNPCTHVCKCGSQYCTGTFHISEEKYNMWQTFQEEQRKKTKNIIAIKNNDLQPLPLYPEKLPVDDIYRKIIM